LELTVARSYADYLLVTDLAILHVERRSLEEQRQAGTILLVMGAFVGPPLVALVEWLGLPGSTGRLYLRPSALPELEDMREVLTCWASDAPSELLSHSKWPRVESHRPVTFYPRSLIEKVALPAWGGMLLTLRREAAREVTLALPWWGRAGVRQHLRRAGYALVERAPALR
jgi:hypothetical protein